MPPLTAELAGYLAVGVLLGIVALIVDPKLRARRAANRLARVRRHAAQGCAACIIRLDLEEQRRTLNTLTATLYGPLGGDR